MGGKFDGDCRPRDALLLRRNIRATVDECRL
jgi:hypothetical protein